MMNGLSQHLRVLMSALHRLLDHPLASLLNILVIGIALSLPSGMYVLVQNVRGLASQVAGAPQISVFLSMNADEDDVARIGKQLKAHEAIDHIAYVSRGQALEQLKRSTGLADVIGGLSQNPLPDAYIVYPKKSAAQSLEALRDELQKWPKVDKVQLDSAWARRLDALLGLGRQAALVLSVLLGLGLVAVTFNTIRLQILTQRDEIEVSRLIGATNSFIRRPFLYFGLLQGLLGGIVAWLIIGYSLHLLNTGLAGLAQLYESSFALHTMTIRDSLALLLFSAYLGWMGAWLSVTRYLRQIGAR